MLYAAAFAVLNAIVLIGWLVAPRLMLVCVAPSLSNVAVLPLTGTLAGVQLFGFVQLLSTVPTHSWARVAEASLSRVSSMMTVNTNRRREINSIMDVD